jgi:Tfp pilus assembly protein PilN
MASGGRTARPKRLYLTGGGALLPGIQEALQEATGLSVGFLSPEGNLLPRSQGAVFALPYAASRAASQQRQRLNLLLPESIAAERTLQRRRIWLAAALAAAVALFTFIGGSFFSLRHKEALLARNAPQWESAKQDLELARVMSEKREHLISQVSLLSQAHGRRHSFLDTVLEINRRAPKGVWLTSLVLEKSAASSEGSRQLIQVSGKAPDNKVVANLESALSEIPSLAKVNLQSLKSARFGTEQVVEFSILCEIETSAGEDSLSEDAAKPPQDAGAAQREDNAP